MISAVRWVIIDRPDDKESHYECDCGFNEYLAETCRCHKCNQYELPLERCPLCGDPFDKKE